MSARPTHNMPARSPGNYQIHLPGMEHLGREVEPPFAIGDPETSRDMVDDRGRRFYHWSPGNDDEVVKPFAGWEGLPNPGIGTEGLGVLELPEGTRSASSVLSGMEAWAGEKPEILDFIKGYVGNVYLKLQGAVDTSLSLDHVAVVNEAGKRRFFVTPPHVLSDDPAVIKQWFEKMAGDVHDVLSTEPSETTEAMVASFLDDIRAIVK